MDQVGTNPVSKVRRNVQLEDLQKIVAKLQGFTMILSSLINLVNESNKAGGVGFGIDKR